MDLKHIAQEALNIVTPAIDRLFEQTNRKELHIVIMNPRLKPWEASFEEAILLETSIKNSPEWALPFEQFARNKAKQAWREQQPNLATQALHPSSLEAEDVPFYGSFVYGNIVVACSGVEQWYDMLIASWIATTIEQLCIAKRAEP